jgi:molybdopterin-guanine dinucleotide biosynthesis protein A
MGSTPPTLAGLVLAGGRSSRFGADKATQLLGGRSLMAWSLAALDAVCAEVAVSAPLGSEAAALADAAGRTVLADDPRHEAGPLAGIAAGLAWAAGAGFGYLATLPCDTPMVGPEILQRLVAVAPAYAVTADGPQALVAIWPTSAGAELARSLAMGRHPSVRQALQACQARPALFEDEGPFRNANTPADLAALARLV